MSIDNAGSGKPRFNRLVASQRRQVSGWSSRPALVSLLAHAVAITGIAYASVHSPALAAGEQELITFADLTPARAEEKKAEAAKPEPPAQREETPPPPPEGTQSLTPPVEAPAAIPAVDVSAPAVQVEDFSGVGTVGGAAAGVEGGTGTEPVPAVEAAVDAYEVSVLEEHPSLRNAAQVVPLLKRLYPPLLREAEVGGIVTMRFVIEADGSVDLSSVKTVDSPHAALSAASVEAVKHLRFRPGRFGGRNVRVVIEMPISWQPPT